jgi:hypothetical protein
MPARVDTGELLQHGHHVPGHAPPAHPDRQAEEAVLVDHVQEFEPSAIGGSVELDIHGPFLVGMLGPVISHRAIRQPCTLPLPRRGPLQTLFPPEPLHPLVIHAPALPPEQPVCHTAAPTDLLSRNLPQAMPELGLFDLDALEAVAVRAAVLVHHLAGQVFRGPVRLLQDHDCPGAALRSQTFPSTGSLSIASSSSASTRSC